MSLAAPSFYWRREVGGLAFEKRANRQLTWGFRHVEKRGVTLIINYCGQVTKNVWKQKKERRERQLVKKGGVVILKRFI